MKIKFLAIIISILFNECSEDINYEVIPLSSFEIKNELLEDKNLVKVLSFSGMPDNNPKIDYYIHMIIVSKETNDTFNLLTIATAGILDDSDREMNFIAQNSTMYNTVLESLKSEKNVKSEESISKVIIDKNFEYNTQNSYPTVIGILGTVTKN